jgi:pyruvate dehydrogenase E2 component (dihydrolipoamide acetyltransferase)
MPDVLMPRLSDTMEEGVLSQWLKGEGDAVHKGDVLAEIETDKATMELEAYEEGVLQRLLVPEGTTVPIGQPIAVIGDGTATSTAAPPAEPMPAPPAAPPAEPMPAHPAAPPASGRGAAAAQIPTSPLARRIARDHGIDLATVVGTGPGGRIVRADVEAAVAAAEAHPASGPAAGPAPRPSQPTTVATAPADDEEVPLSTVRRITARRLTESAAAPHFYLISVVDAERLLAFRTEVNDRLAQTGTKVSVTDLLVRACAVTLRAHPQVNSSWGGDKILRHRRIHVGVAVALDDGLIVPVVRDADRKSLGEIGTEAHALAERARAGQLTPDEFTGGTFTISNLGMYGVDHFTAVINPPEAAILAVGAATEEPAVRDGQLVGRTTIKLTLSIDHRVLDGATAAAFLRDLKDTLQEPLRIVV